jgi:hypothetical protein
MQGTLVDPHPIFSPSPASVMKNVPSQTDVVYLHHPTPEFPAELIWLEKTRNYPELGLTADYASKYTYSRTPRQKAEG